MNPRFYQFEPTNGSGYSNEPLKIGVVTHFIFTLHFDYVFTTNESDDLLYFVSICQDMYEITMSRGIVKILYTNYECVKHGKSWHIKALQEVVI